MGNIIFENGTIKIQAVEIADGRRLDHYAQKYYGNGLNYTGYSTTTSSLGFLIEKSNPLRDWTIELDFTVSSFSSSSLKLQFYADGYTTPDSINFESNNIYIKSHTSASTAFFNTNQTYQLSNTTATNEFSFVIHRFSGFFYVLEYSRKIAFVPNFYQAISQAGYYPVYTTANAANSVSPIGTSTSYSLGKTYYYMPNYVAANEDPALNIKFLGDHNGTTISIPSGFTIVTYNPRDHANKHESLALDKFAIHPGNSKINIQKLHYCNNSVNSIQANGPFTLEGISNLYRSYLRAVAMSPLNISKSITINSIQYYQAIQSETNTTAYNVTVVNGKFILNGNADLDLSLDPGQTYVFNQRDSSNSGHPVSFSLSDSDSSQAAGVSFIGTPGSFGSNTTYVVPSDLGDSSVYMYCVNHGYDMGSNYHPPLPSQEFLVYRFVVKSTTGGYRGSATLLELSLKYQGTLISYSSNLWSNPPFDKFASSHNGGFLPRYAINDSISNPGGNVIWETSTFKYDSSSGTYTGSKESYIGAQDDNNKIVGECITIFFENSIMIDAMEIYRAETWGNDLHQPASIALLGRNNTNWDGTDGWTLIKETDIDLTSSASVEVSLV